MPTVNTAAVRRTAEQIDEELYLGTGAAFGWGVTPVAAASRVTFTQTYSTALATNPAVLTDSSGGTPAATLPAISGTYSQSEVRDSIASLNAQIVAVQKLCNSIIDALQAQGIVL